MAYFDRTAYVYGHRRNMVHAVEIEQDVFAQRKEKLGREHIYTLWAGLNLARIKALRGEIDEALAIFLPGHDIAWRNLGEDHFGVLFGEMHHGRILLYAKSTKKQRICSRRSSNRTVGRAKGILTGCLPYSL